MAHLEGLLKGLREAVAARCAALAVARKAVAVDSGSTDGTIAEAAGARTTSLELDARQGAWNPEVRRRECLLA